MRLNSTKSENHLQITIIVKLDTCCQLTKTDSSTLRFTITNHPRKAWDINQVNTLIYYLLRHVELEFINILIY